MNCLQPKLTVDLIPTMWDKGLNEKEIVMIIVNDIQDAMIMKKKLRSVLRRSDMFGMNKSHIQLEIDMIVRDLDKNISRIEANMLEEV